MPCLLHSWPEVFVQTETIKRNYLKINEIKTQAIIVGPSSYEYEFLLNSREVNVSDTLKILGVSFDRMLTYKDYLTAQLKKAYAKTTALRRIRRFIPTNMVRLYQTFILPHFEYCSPLLIGLGKIQGNRLEDANYYILTSLLGLPKSETYDNRQLT